MNLKVFFLLILTSLSWVGPLGANSETLSVSDPAFNGTLSLLSDGRLALILRDGSRIFVGPRASVDPQRIGKAGQPSCRKDPTDRIIFAADRHFVLIYTFRYARDNAWVIMTDPQAMVTRFGFDKSTGKIREAQLSSGRKILFP
jgi:hypothetical protein